MTFYLKHPRGELSLYNIERCVEQRLQFYKNYKKINDNEHCYDCLVEDSAFDRTGHFMLRLHACKNVTFKYKFMRMEVKLLEARLGCYEASDLRIFLKRLQKHSTENLETYDLPEQLVKSYQAFIKVSSAMMEKNYLSHIYSNQHIKSNYCEEFIIDVPFYVCPSLLRNRVINLNKGFLKVTCKDWKSCLLSLYENYLSVVLAQMKLSTKVPLVLEEERIKYIQQIVESFYVYQEEGQQVTKFNVFNINSEVKFFPLCMLNLYQILRDSNRLAHNERFDFGLYLKGIGVPMEHALKFWEILYSKQHSSCSRCTHDWTNNEKRYTYSVRHLYGLEGARKQYNMKSCRTLQNSTLGAREAGGCPFQHSDDEHLRKLLSAVLPNNEKQVDMLIKNRRKSPESSCKLYYNIMYKKNTAGTHIKNVSFHNPVQYYVSLKKLIE